MNKKIRALLDQVEDNKVRERHANYAECRYWARQWKFLAIELAWELKRLTEDDE
jgi:hypothetical protein